MIGEDTNLALQEECPRDENHKLGETNCIATTALRDRLQHVPGKQPAIMEGKKIDCLQAIIEYDSVLRSRTAPPELQTNTDCGGDETIATKTNGGDGVGDGGGGGSLVGCFELASVFSALTG